MPAIEHAFSLGRWTRWIAWLRRELAPLPGREITVLRIVVTVMIVTIVSMTLQVPQLFFSAFFIFFVTKENRVLTMVTGSVMIAGATIAMAISLFLYRFTFDYPEVRVPVMAGLIFTGMFLSRVFFIGPLGFVVGFFAALTQTTAENAPDTDTLVRGVLWLWVLIVYPVALTVILNQILLPAHPWDALVQALTVRLNGAATALRRILKAGSAGGQSNPELLELATRGNSTMRMLLNFAESKDPELKHRHNSLAATIAASEYLISTTAAIEFRQEIAITEADRTCATAMLTEIERLENSVRARHPILPPNQPGETDATLPQLREMQFALRSFHDGLVKEDRAELARETKAPRKPMFVADAFTNPAHVRFALKVTLAAMVCYFIYAGLKWPGISTSFVTCCFIALENTGATMRKGWLRLIGCAVGGVLGYGAIIFLIPHMESIVSLVLLTAVATAVAAWVATGSDRISYAGLQGAFAFYMCIFQGYAPDTNFTLVRDRLIGIALGIAAASLVFHYVWPDHAIDNLRVVFARLLRKISQLLVIPKSGAAMEQGKIDQLREEITRDVDSTLKLTELTSFENPKTSGCPGLTPARLDEMVVHAQSLSLMTAILQGATKQEEWRRLAPGVQQSESSLRQSAAGHLQRIAAFVETGRRAPADEMTPALSAWNETVAGVSGNDRPRLVRRVIEQIQKLS